jgi:hypothetical protein
MCQTSLAQSHFEAVVDLLGQEAISLQLLIASDNLTAAIKEFSRTGITRDNSTINKKNITTNNSDLNEFATSNNAVTMSPIALAKRRYSLDSLTVCIC